MVTNSRSPSPSRGFSRSALGSPHPQLLHQPSSERGSAASFEFAALAMVDPEAMDEDLAGEELRQAREKDNHNLVVGGHLKGMERKLWLAFSQADIDGSGAISKRELYSSLEALGVCPSASAFVKLFDDADANNDGAVSFEEFKELANKIRAIKKKAAATHEPEDTLLGSKRRPGTDSRKSPLSTSQRCPPLPTLSLAF